MLRERISTKLPPLTEEEERVVELLDILDEARRRIGLRKFRRIKRVHLFASAKARGLKKVKKIYRPWRVGAVHNRHR
jgi:hypothetical protein